MSECSDPTDTFWSDQLVTAKQLAGVYNAAILALAVNGVQSYQLDTGQTRQLVTKINLASLRLVRDGLLNEVATLEARLYGAGVTRVVPGW